MIRVVYEPNAHSMGAEGHAGSAPYGEDLVCAAVSALMLTLSRAAWELEKQGYGACGGCIATGLGRVWFQPKAGCEPIVRAMMNTVAIGMEMLAEDYSDCVEFVVREETRKEERNEV